MELVIAVPGKRIVFVGEGMVELRQSAGGEVTLGYGGDTLNTAIHMARFGLDVDFASALGDDPFSERLRAAWTDEGVDCSAIVTDPERGAGLYAISLDEDGERSFTYWRSDSAARQMFALPDSSRLLEQVRTADMLVFSLISLAILPECAREELLDLARSLSGAGGTVVFDGNYRPLLWEDAATAARWRDRAIAAADIGLPTLEDEIAIGGVSQAEDVTAHWQGLGCAEVIVKDGARGCVLPDGEILAPGERLQPVDTSGAGDAFNAGYLAARLGGADVRHAAVAGHSLAGWSIMRQGAIPARDGDAPYTL